MSSNVKMRLDIREDLTELFDNRFKREVASELIEMIKDFLSKGISPVRGNRKFPSYKNPEKYPAGQKPKTPVNLELSSDMLNAMTYWFIRDSIRIGFKDEDQHDKAKTHQYGLNGVPQRPILPVEEGDELAISIMQELRRIYSEKLIDIIKKSNR